MKIDAPSEALVAAFDAALPDDPRVERRKMFGMPAAFACGHMFAGLFGESMTLRLPEEERAAFVERHGGEAFAPMGRTMREYLVVPPAMVADSALVGEWCLRSLAHVASLPPKTPKKRARKA